MLALLIELMPDGINARGRLMHDTKNPARWRGLSISIGCEVSIHNCHHLCNVLGLERDADIYGGSALMPAKRTDKAVRIVKYFAGLT